MSGSHEYKIDADKRKTYLFKVHYYSEHYEETFDAYGIIGAQDYIEAVGRIQERFPDIEYMTIKELFFYDGFWFFNERQYDKAFNEEDDDEGE